MKIKTLPIHELMDAPYNPRIDLKPEDIEYQKLKKSIKEFDYVEPIIYNEKTGNIVGGHQRVKVLKELGYDEIDVSVVHLSETKEKSLNLALNKISGEWDYPKLKDVLEELDTGAFDMEITGFDDGEIEDLLTQYRKDEKEDIFDPEEEAEKIETPMVSKGDIWQLGNHRIMCGNSAKIEDVQKLMAKKKADMIFTSPPYADQREYDIESEFKPIRHEEYVGWFEPIAANIITIMKDKASFFLNIKEDVVNGERSLYVMELILHLKKNLGFCYLDEFIWKKNGLPGKWDNRLKNGFEPIHFMAKDPMKVDCFIQEVEYEEDHNIKSTIINDFENIYHFTKTKKIKAHPKRRGKKSNNVIISSSNNVNKSRTGNVGVKGKTKKGIALPSNVIEIVGNQDSIDHPAMYSVKLVEWFLNIFTNRNAIIYEPFSGGGTNIIACENQERQCYAMEISPKYVDVAIKRWEQHTGEKAVKIHG